MPRYYLDIVIGTRRIPCHDGYELPNPQAAHDQACREIRSLLSNQTAGMLDPKDCHVEVNDEAHRFLFKVDISEGYGVKSRRHERRNA
jgi:hypothetical protein